MKYLTADFGSTYTKLTAIDATKAEIIGTSAAFTTIDSDVMEGYNCALQRLEEKIGALSTKRSTSLVCSVIRALSISN